MTGPEVTPRERSQSQAQAALEFAKQAQKLGCRPSVDSDTGEVSDNAVKAIFVTGQDPAIETASGERLPPVPVEEAVRLNDLRDRMKGREPSSKPPVMAGTREAKDGTIHGAVPQSSNAKSNASLVDNAPVYYTNPLFPPLPMYGPPSTLIRIQCLLFQFVSFIGSLAFLVVIILGAAVTSIPLAMKNVGCRLKLQDPNSRRPFYEEELRRARRRQELEAAWQARNSDPNKSSSHPTVDGDQLRTKTAYMPTEGGPDPLVCDASYYARRVGLDIESFDVETEDGFIIELMHVFDPQERAAPASSQTRQKSSQDSSEGLLNGKLRNGMSKRLPPHGQRRYPVLLMHGLLQSGGAYCCNDEDSLAFFLFKSGYDVWLGNNRCGFKPRHTLLSYSDPRMWSHNIRSFGNFDLKALIDTVLSHTKGFEKLGLVCHSQGTTQTFVALAKEQRPEIGEKISVFCALAPAVYAGPLIQKFYFKIMRVITPSMFRLVFGIHAFIPFMMSMHSLLPAKLYGSLGYRVFSFLFNWTDDRWEQDIRDRFFQFSPTYVSAESMRWWLGRECFAKHECILATKREGELENEEDEEEDDFLENTTDTTGDTIGAEISCTAGNHHHKDHGRYAWYDERAPPMAFWIAGNDDLVDGKRLLRRFGRGREPNVELVHSKVIEGYEHLDVLWSMDAIEQVGMEVREVIWRTASLEAKRLCRIPDGCENKKVVRTANGGLVDRKTQDRHPDKSQPQNVTND